MKFRLPSMPARREPAIKAETVRVGFQPASDLRAGVRRDGRQSPMEVRCLARRVSMAFDGCSGRRIASSEHLLARAVGQVAIGQAEVQHRNG